MPTAVIPRAEHEFWSMQDTVIGPLTIGWPACDFVMV
jgi:hypothetical protein